MSILIALVSALTTLAASRTLLHLLQLESYQLPGYRRAVFHNPWRACWPGLVCGVANIILIGVIAWRVNRLYVALDTSMDLQTDVLWILAAALLCLIAGAAMEQIQRRTPAKKPFVITARIKRLYGTLFLVTLVWNIVFLYAVRIYAIALLTPIGVSAFVALAVICAQPMEKAISNRYFRDAQKKLADRPDLIKVGITGSYGKTSTKFMLAAILSEKYRTLATPSSYNTPMGLTRVIREQLEPEHQVFIAEMGARHVGDIKELCELVHPKYGILTSVGLQHLETFFSQENITKTKYELIEALPEDGVAVFPADGAICEELYKRPAKHAKHLTGERAEGRGMLAKDVAVGPWGSRFTLINADGQEALCETRLLGTHNIGNLMLACTMADVLGLTMEEITAGVKKVEPVEHRLQILHTDNGVTVIDDAFNSNPKGAHAALEVLKAFPQRRILITPGMVELGADEASHNRTFGEAIKDAADLVILVGHHHTEPIAEGLAASGFSAENIHRVASLAEAQVKLGELVQTGDTVLFENDLPDNYTE